MTINIIIARTENPTTSPTVTPTRSSCPEDDDEDDSKLVNEDGGGEKMAEKVAVVVVVDDGEFVLGTTTVTVWELDRFVKFTTFVVCGRVVDSGSILGGLGEGEDICLRSTGQACDSSQGSTEQQPTNLFAAQ